MHNPPRFGFVGQIRAGANITLTQDALGYTIAGDAGGGGGGGSLVYSNTTVPAGNTVANTASETAFTSSYDIPADSLVVGDVIRIDLFGVYSTDALLAPTLQGKIKFDSTTMIDTGAVTAIVGVTNVGWSAKAVFIVNSIGATGSIESQGFAQFATAATTSLSVNAENTAPITIDTTVDQTITVTVQWGTADTDNTITLREMTIYHDALVGVLSRGYPSGTAFPSSPATNDIFVRTDRDNTAYFWNATRWLTTQQYTIQFLPYVSLGSTGMTATTAFKMIAWKPCAAATDFWMETAIIAGTVQTTNNISNHFIIEFESDDATSGSPTDIVDINTNTEGWTVAQFSVASASINALLGTGQRILYIDCTEVGTSGLSLYDAKIVGRLVG